MNSGGGVVVRDCSWLTCGGVGLVAVWLGRWVVEGWWFFDVLLFMFYLFLFVKKKRESFGCIELGCVAISELDWSVGLV